MLLNSDEQRTGSSAGASGHKKVVTTSSKIHQCPYCSYTSKKTTNLKNHIRIHTGERPYSCPHCPYRATQENNMKSHIRTHTGEKPYACNFCQYRAIKISTLRRHMQTHHYLGWLFFFFMLVIYSFVDFMKTFIFLVKGSVMSTNSFRSSWFFVFEI